MTAVWNTKFGPRRVKKNAPTIAEALSAARDMADELDQQVEIAASLIGEPVETVRAEALKLGMGSKRLSVNVVSMPAGRGAPTRTVIVERTPSRRIPSKVPPREIGRR